MDLRTRRKLKKLHGLMGSSDNEKERESARQFILEILKRHKLSWVELPELISKIPDDDPQSTANNYKDSIGLLDLVEGMLRRYVQLKDHEYVAVTLWIVHTHFYDRFAHTPRLALTSPTFDCGKTTVLLMLNSLCAAPHKSDDVTPAALFRLIDSGVTTLLCDEIDNADLASNRTFRTIANGGYRRGGKVVRTIDGQPRSFDTFAPMALAAIGALSLPQPLRSRSISVHMERADGSSEITRFDEVEDKNALDSVRQSISLWASTATLAADPAMPKGLRGRLADNWRSLLSVADPFGEEWGERARLAAMIMARDYYEDIPVTLLRDIRKIFDGHSVDRIASAALVEALLDLEDGPWSEWRGLKDDQQPRKLTQATLASVLKAFHIRPRSIWPAGRTADTKSRKGYYRSDFEAAWRTYCPEDGTPAQPNVLKVLHGG